MKFNFNNYIIFAVNKVFYNNYLVVFFFLKNKMYLFNCFFLNMQLITQKKLLLKHEETYHFHKYN